MEEFGDRLRAPKERELTERLTESTNLDPSDSQESDPPTKEHTLAGPKPSPAQMSRCAVGAVSKAVACLWSMCPL